MPPPERRDVWDRQGEEALNIIRAKFDIQWDSSKPAMLFFQVDGSRISHGRWVSFPDERYEDTFIAMKTLLKAAADSLAKVQPEYERNTGELFYLVDNALQNESFKRNFRFLYKTVKAIKGLLF